MNRSVISIFSLILALSLILCISSCSAGYKGPVSDHFNGSQFHNKEPHYTFSDMIKWFWEMETVNWPEWVEDPKQPVPSKKVDKGNLRVTYINHATVLVQMDGINILTDPVWSTRVGPFSWFGVKRVRDPGVKMVDLPKIDYVLISHDHYDHLDLPSLKDITERDKPTVLVGLGLKSYLVSHEIDRVVELDWWRDYKPESVDIVFTYVPAIHNSGRYSLIMANKTLWGGFVINGSQGRQVYFAGDTAYGDFLQEIGKRFKQIDLAILPIGSYEKRWFMKTQHMNPDDAVRTHIVLGAKQNVGMHFGTFAEHPEQTIDAHEKDLAQAIKLHRISVSQFWVLKFGEGRNVLPHY